MQHSIDLIVKNITETFIDPIITLFYVLAFLYFFWGMALFVLNSNDQKKRQEGRDHMMWGVIGLFIVFSVWGILNFVDLSIEALS